MVLPTKGPAAQEPTKAIWRRTDEGWLRAEEWLSPHVYLYREPRPPVYPVALLPMIVTLSVAAIVLGQPEQP